MKLSNILSRSILLPLLILVCGTGCVREDEYQNDLAGNFDALWQCMDRNYCFFDYKKEVYGLDWDSVYAVYRPRINNQMTQQQFFEVCCDMLGELRDGHVNLYSSGDVGRNWSWREDYPANFNDSVHQLYLGTDYKIASGLKYRILEDNIAYVYYESFSSAIGDGNITAMMTELKTCNGMILDVRNNSGGNLTYATKLSGYFTNEKRLVGYIAHKNGPGHSDFSTPEPEYIEPANGLRWQKPVVVLTNRSCYSSTNTFVRNMKVCPQVTIMGDRTGGGSGMPFTSEMPNGWLVRFSACPMYDADMQQIEFGIEPDIPVNMNLEDLKKNKDTQNIPIIFITAKDTENDTLTGFNLGADDYISKPFSLREVIMRVKAVLRRTAGVQTQVPEQLIYKGLSVNIPKKKVTINNEEISLTKKEFEILLLLLQNQGRVFSREDILAKVWHDEVYVLDRTIDVNITRLRKKIGEYGACIVTRLGYGYCFECE